MKVGTRSILYGAHAFYLHPWFVARAWWKLYGFPWDPRLWIAFFVHDLGYWGMPNMDGPEGEEHPRLGARIMSVFDIRGWAGDSDLIARTFNAVFGDAWKDVRFTGRPCSWYQLCFYHSRFMAKRYGIPVSKLCIADKLAIVLTPSWLYLPMARATGEIAEYMALADARCAAGEPKYASMQLATDDQHRWYLDVQEYLRRWVEEHKDGRADTWTPEARRAETDTGVWS